MNVGGEAALLEELGRRLARGEGFAVATLNLDHLAKLAHDPAFRRAYASHDLVTADGNPVVWLARLAGRPVALAPGADLLLPVLALAARAGAPVALVGSTEASLAGAALRLRAEVPGIEIRAEVAPPMGFDPDGEAAMAILDGLQAQGVRLALLALGAPKQERLAALGRARVPGMGFLCIGAGLDFLSGAQRRAPPLVRRLALEWLFRAMSDPRRLLGRYARAALVLPRHALAALAQRRRGV